ncbi:MAG TPA: M20/M25/M40 family metallo-hydrolase [Ignavibacteria bacterium]|nr:M20/M25/M40 family metallo-hydrolase [Ignavibacteria bacterium]
MRKYILILFILVLCGFGIQNDGPEITKEELKEHLMYLADSSLAGRFPGTEGDRLAQEYIIKEFQKSGLKPAGMNGTYIQEFKMATQMKLGDNNSATISTGDTTYNLTPKDNYTPLGFTGNGSASGNLVFVGYGIDAPEQNYDDFKDTLGNNLNLQGKILIMMRFGPDHLNPHGNPFEKYEDTRYKTLIPRDEGAAGIIVINGPEFDENDRLMRVRYDNMLANQGIPIINVKRDIINAVLKANGYDIKELQKKINDANKSYSFELAKGSASFETMVTPTLAKTGNILGFLEGNDPVLKNEVVVIGAHYDHVGLGLYGSLAANKEEQIHYGADDNASGTTATLEIAEKLAANRKDLKRSVLLMLFGAEEAGIIGSAYFTNSDLFKQYNIVAMLNMDMIGRYKDKLTIYGIGTSPIWETMLTNINNTTYKFDIGFVPDGYGPSDHSSFYAKNIPVLHFFTGTHEDYHRPSDTFDKINYDAQQNIARMVYDVAIELINAPKKPEFTVVKKEQQQTQTTGQMKVTVGTIPDYGFTGEGLKITGVREGSPGAKAGLLAGDVIIKFGETSIKNIYDYTNVLGKYNPDDEVDIIVKRGEQELTLHVKLEKRN